MGQALQREQPDLIDEAFEQAWAVLESDPQHSVRDTEVVKALLQDKLLLLMDAGVVDVELMRKIALGAILKHERDVRRERGNGDDGFHSAPCSGKTRVSFE